MRCVLPELLKNEEAAMAHEDIYTINQSRDSSDIINLSICGITHPDKNYSITRKNANMACIEYIEKGMGTVNIDDETFFPSEGDSYFLHCGKNHYYYSDKENPWKKYFINVSGSLLESFIEGYGLKGIHHYENLDIKNELCEIIELAKDSDNDRSNEIICILNRIFLKMHESIKNKSGQSEIAEKMKNFLSVHVAGKFKIDELCRHVSRSESQTIRIFKNAYGITPYAYVIDKKISLAKNLLINTNLTVRQIAYKLCFADEYYFSNVFKLKTGISPTQFRKQGAVAK